MVETKVEQQATSKTEGARKERIGFVISDRMKKTVVVECQRQFRHPRYLKVIRQYKKFYAHDEQGKAKRGDLVRIVETRPLSRLKRWRLAEVLKKADQGKLEVADVL